MDISFGFNSLYEQKTQLGYPYPQTVRAYDRETKTYNNTLIAGLKGKLTRFYSLQGDLQFMNYRRNNSLYLKDVSFESPSAPAVFKENLQPAINMNINTASTVLEDGVHEVVLSATITAEIEKRTS